MKKNNYIYIEGFTLIEMLINMIIISTLTLSVIFVFYQIQVDMNLNEVKDNMVVYGNTILDDLELELSKSQKIIRTTQSSNNTSLDLYYPNNEPRTKYFISFEEGLFKNDTRLDTYNPFNTLANGKKILRYRMSEFTIDEPTLSTGDVWSFEANEARYASYEIILEIDLYNTAEEIIETLKFKRRVFSPAKFIYNQGINNA